MDDDLDSNLLINLLRSLGHEVISPRAVGTRGAPDEEHLRYAADNHLVLMSANAGDFVQLSRQWAEKQIGHSGVLIVYRENNPTRDMSFREIAEAVWHGRGVNHSYRQHLSEPQLLAAALRSVCEYSTSFLIKCPSCGDRNVCEFRFGGGIVQSPAPQRRSQWEIGRYLTMS